MVDPNDIALVSERGSNPPSPKDTESEWWTRTTSYDNKVWVGAGLSSLPGSWGTRTFRVRVRVRVSVMVYTNR